MKTLIVLTATPGSGKSTWSKMYQSRVKNTYIISSDEIRYELTGSYQDFSKQNEVWDVFDERMHEYATKSDDVTVILDALTDLNTLRMAYLRNTPEYDKHILVCIYKKYEDVVRYNKERDEEHWVPDNILEALYKKFEKPSDEVRNAYDEVLEITGYFK